MKNKKSIVVILVSMLAFSCSTYEHLPTFDEVRVSPYGAQIEIGASLYGELIAIDSSKMIILTDSTLGSKIVSFNLEQVSGFTLRYAQNEDYGFSIILLPALTISHGVFLIITAPINLIVSISAAVGGQNAFTYNESEISLDDLKMFARFPQGIPPNIDLNQVE